MCTRDADGKQKESWTSSPGVSESRSGGLVCKRLVPYRGCVPRENKGRLCFLDDLDPVLQ